MNERTGTEQGSSKVRAGSSITDELREYVQDWRDTPSLMDDLDRGDIDGILEDFIRIADRIDAEYQKAIRELNNFADASVLLPMDADGVPIRVGDRMAFEDGEEFDVIGISDSTLFYVDDDFADAAAWTQAGNKHHVQPDSWERIIEDAANFALDTQHTAGRISLEPFVERCRRLAGERE